MTEGDIRARVKRAVEERGSLDGMRHSFRTILNRQSENAGRVPDLEDRKQRLRKTKEACVGGEAVFVQAIASLRENGFRVIIAKTRESALKVVFDEIGDSPLVVKSKSNVTKELHLAEELQARGVQVIETDLGDRIVQLAGCMPAHPTGPACHLTRGEISALFTKHFGRPVSDDPRELTEVMREEIARYLSESRIGITGANAITASEGAVVIVHNEGNAGKCAMVPDKHIIITTPDKIVPTLDDAVNVTKLQTYLSTGKVISSYINVITGPSYTADIEKRVYKGMHGPKEVIVLFVDDGRLSAEDKQPQYCIGCGMCLLHCPVYDVIGPTFGTSGHMGGQGVYLAGSIGKLEEAVDSGLFLCTTCGSCTEVCPSRIETKEGIPSIRGEARGAGIPLSKEHMALVASIANYENPMQVPRLRKQKWARGLGLREKGEVLYFAGCSTSLLSQGTAQAVVRILRSIGVEPAYLGKAERCCGSTLRKLGDEQEARKRAEACFRDFESAGAKVVVTSCPGCASSLRRYEDLAARHGLKVQHITEFLGEHRGGIKGKAKVSGRVTYHDPCDLGRGLGITKEPRLLLSQILSKPMVEMERSGKSGACCGSGSGVKTSFPELSEAIAEDRIRMAKDAGATMIVTSCPWCVQSLRECQHADKGIEVVDLVDLIDRAIAGTGKVRPCG